MMRVLIILSTCIVLLGASERADVDTAIDSGLEFLRSMQLPDGSIEGRGSYRTTMTSLTILAHLSAGVTYRDPEVGPSLRRALDYILDNGADSSGYFGGPDGSRMYGHGITMMMLSDSLGMTDDDLLDERIFGALRQASDVSVRAARVEKGPDHGGGWRYQPDDTQSDLSVTAWQLMALEACRSVGVEVPQAIIDAGYGYVDRCVEDTGRVRYQPNRYRGGLQGLGLLLSHRSARIDGAMVERMTTHMQQERINLERRYRYYRIYYDLVGLSVTRPSNWQLLWQERVDELLDLRDESGVWQDHDHGRVYATAFAVMALSTKGPRLPSHGR